MIGWSIETHDQLEQANQLPCNEIDQLKFRTHLTLYDELA